MAKFEVELEITGFKLKMKGEKETVGELGAALRSQLASAFLPGVLTPNDDPPPAAPVTTPPKTIEGRTASRKGSGRKRQAPAAEGESPIIDFQHDPHRFANPVQTWRPYEKAIWLIYVLSKQTGVTHFTPTELSETFNKNFSKAGVLRPSNVSRDLGTQKSANPPLVQQDPKSDKFGLFEAGDKHVEKLINTILTPQ